MITCENLVGDIWFDGTRRQGRFYANSQELIEMFGRPGVFINEYAEWALRFVCHNGKVICATIYPASVDNRGNNLQPGLYEVGGYGPEALYAVEYFLTGRIALEVA